MCHCYNQNESKYIFKIFLIMIKPLKFNNFRTKGSNAMKLAQMKSSMHKGGHWLFLHGIWTCDAKVMNFSK